MRMIINNTNNVVKPHRLNLPQALLHRLQNDHNNDNDNQNDHDDDQNDENNNDNDNQNDHDDDQNDENNNDNDNQNVHDDENNNDNDLILVTTKLPFNAPSIFLSSIFLVCIGFNHLSMK